VVECWDPPMNWGAVWRHQLRWARTIRVCQPVPYFFSILSNAGLWAMVCFIIGLANRPAFHAYSFNDGTTSGFAYSFHASVTAYIGGFFVLLRIIIAQNLQSRLTRSSDDFAYFWLVPLKDLLQGAIWLCAFVGNRIEWRGQVYRLRRDGTLIKTDDRRGV